MSYYVFSRKYRPQKFAEVLAQRHITETLTRAIEHDRIAQAYLFCGVRGTGKTTVARILAKRLNCANPQGAEPCDACESCLGIIKGRSLDILEIDAASHTSVDDVRELREAIKYSPVGGKYKVYIIDEVHRLSGSAFDALLKTLEEPPAHAVFVFATTEAQKVPQTILSRCQRYDFRRISESELRSAIKGIAEKENLTVTDDAVAELARRGDGSLRDALSILDQVASWQQDKIDLALITQALGILPRSEYRDWLIKIRNRDSAALLQRVDEVLRAGVSAAEFVRGFQEEVRFLLVFKAAPDIGADYGVTPEEAADYKARAADYEIGDLLRIQQVLVDLEGKIRDGFEPVINLELTLLKLVQMEATVSVEAILKTLSGAQPSAVPFDAQAAEAKKKSAPVAPATTAPAAIAALPSNNAAADGGTMAGTDSDEGAASLWDRFLQALKPRHRSLQIKLTLAQPRSIEGNRFSVAFDRLGEVHVRYFQDRSIQQTLEQVIRDVAGRELRLHFFVDPGWAPKVQMTSTDSKAALFTDADKTAHPMVAQAIEILDAEIVARRDV